MRDEKRDIYGELETPPHPQQLMADAWDLYRKGMALEQIAEKLQASRDEVRECVEWMSAARHTHKPRLAEPKGPERAVPLGEHGHGDLLSDAERRERELSPEQRAIRTQNMIWYLHTYDRWPIPRICAAYRIGESAVRDAIKAAQDRCYHEPAPRREEPATPSPTIAVAPPPKKARKTRGKMRLIPNPDFPDVLEAICPACKKGSAFQKGDDAPALCGHCGIQMRGAN